MSFLYCISILTYSSIIIILVKINLHRKLHPQFQVVKFVKEKYQLARKTYKNARAFIDKYVTNAGAEIQNYKANIIKKKNTTKKSVTKKKVVKKTTAKKIIKKKTEKTKK